MKFSHIAIQKYIQKEILQNVYFFSSNKIWTTVRIRYFNNHFQLDFWLVDWVYKPFLFFTIEWHLSGVWVCYNIIKKNTLMGLTYMMRPLRNNFLARICLSKRNIISWIREYTGNKHLYHCQCITILCSFLDRHFNVRYSKYLHY